MIICNSCERISGEALVLKEVHYECDEWPYETIPVCPYCFDTDILSFEGNEYND